MEPMRLLSCPLLNIGDLFSGFVEDSVGSVAFDQSIHDSNLRHVSVPDVGHRCRLQHIEDHIFGCRLEIIWEDPNGVAFVDVNGIGSSYESL